MCECPGCKAAQEILKLHALIESEHREPTDKDTQHIDRLMGIVVENYEVM